MKIFLFFFIIFIHLTAISQTKNESKAFDSIYYEIAINISSSHPTKAMHLADSLYNYSLNDKQRTKSLMLTASIYEKQEQRREAIQYALKAVKIAEDSKNYFFQASIYRFMSAQYRQLGFSDKGKEYIQKGRDISSKINDKTQVTKYQAMANHELANYAMDENQYEKAIEYIDLALLGYQKEEDDYPFKSFKISTAEELLGRCYMGLGKNDDAFENFSKANTLIIKSGSGNGVWAGMIYQGMGAIYLRKKQLDSAELYLKKALMISEESSHGTLKEILYETMSKYYKDRGNLDSSAIYASKYRDISKENSFKKNQMVNSEFNRLTSISEEKANNTPLHIGTSIVLGLGIILTAYHFRRRKNPKTITQDINEEIKKSNGVLISLHTEKELLTKIKEFESSDDFLEKNISFSVLVGNLNTNAKYLNHILKTVKKKDFNTFINDLRIAYILEKLDSDPDFLNYKISYLAKVSGFSSHSNFSANFKRVTEFSPSEYIESLNQSA